MSESPSPPSSPSLSSSSSSSSSEALSARVRVGKIPKSSKEKPFPNYADFQPIVVKLKSNSKWWPLSPFYSVTSDGALMENAWQFSKVYEKIPKQRIPESRFRPNKIIWEYPAETLAVKGDDGEWEVTDQYWNWRQKGFANPDPVRYPVGFKGRTKCLFALYQNPETDEWEQLDYIDARKKLYCRLYADSVRNDPLFKELQSRVQKGEKVTILDVDGPTILLKKKLEYPFDQIDPVSSTIPCTETLIKAFLNEPSIPFGHGFVLATMLVGGEHWLYE